MRFQATLALLLQLSACATPAPGPRASVAPDPRLVNLQRAAQLPWTDEGRCAVRESAQPWPVLVERCYPALDHDRIELHDLTGRCAVASMGAAAMGLGMCILIAPEVVAGAVIITGVLVVGVFLKVALETYAEKRGGPVARPVLETKPVPQEPSPKKKPESEPGGPEVPPIGPIGVAEQDRRPECRPRRVKHRGGNRLHDECADKIPTNDFSGWDVLVNGKNFDALQSRTRTLWEVKTHDIESYKPFLWRIELEKQVTEALRERDIAAACGYDFVIGVRTGAHQAALLKRNSSLSVVVMDWC